MYTGLVQLGHRYSKDSIQSARDTRKQNKENREVSVDILRIRSKSYYCNFCDKILSETKFHFLKDNYKTYIADTGKEKLGHYYTDIEYNERKNDEKPRGICKDCEKKALKWWKIKDKQYTK